MSAANEGPVKHAWPGRFGRERLKILRATSRRPHRYRIFRALTVTLSLSALALVPLTGLARWPAIIPMAIAMFVFFFFTFNVNLVAGRMFCGWGCPIGQLNRLTDDFKAQRTSGRRLAFGFVLVVFACFFSLSLLLWWTSLDSVFAFVALAAMTAAALAFARWWGWDFCRKVCPIGLYYSVVQTSRPLGILYDRSRCTDEGACVRACPVDLDARNLAAPKHGIGGFAIDGLTENSHCLRCGACVEACELVTHKVGAPALFFGRPEEKREARPVLPAMQVPEPLPIVAEEIAPAIERAPKRITSIVLMVVVALFLGSYAAIAAHRASRYTPVETWSEARNEAPRNHAARNEERLPTAHAAPRSIVPIQIEGGAFGARTFVAHAKDRLELINRDPTLHTVHISNGPRSLIHVPLPPGRKPRSVAAPAPGRYRIACDSHQGEEAELLVLKQEANP